MVKLNKILANCTGFEWDHGNITKNWDKHDVSAGECEQKNNGVRPSFLTVYRHNVKNEDLTLRLFRQPRIQI